MTHKLSIMSIKFLLIFLVELSRCADEVPGNITDLSICKVSHLGVEYLGNVAKSESGARCQSWTPTRPVHKIADTITDSSFPDGSKRAARNYCRNPTREERGPWCYTMDPNLIDDTCGIPLCSFTECRITGSGSEYAGLYNVAVSGRKCLKWNKDRKKVKTNGVVTRQDRFKPDKFPDDSLSKAKKYCRNPDGDLGGPWCFVDMEDSDEVEREYCDVPFCDDQDCMVYAKNSSVYSHYTAFNETYDNITFAIKLWDPDSFFEGTASLLLTLMALPVRGYEIGQLGIGFEIVISNNQTGLRFGSKDAPEYDSTPGILKATEYTTFSLSWSNGIVTLQKAGSIKPIFLSEFDIKSNLLGYKKDIFYYYSAQGSGVMWSFPFCDDDFNCDVHVTTTDFFQQFWPLHQTDLGVDLHFHVRASHSCHILLTPGPTVDFPFIKITLQLPDNYTRVETGLFKGGSTILLKEIALVNLLDYWKWREFSLSIFADNLQLYWTKDVGTYMLFEVKHEVFKKMRWFSPSSGDTNAHWTFFCKPPKSAMPPPAWLPECALNWDEGNYEGTQDVTSAGNPCLPWSGKKLLPEDASKFISGDEFKAWNYCRDPHKKMQGTYCYVLTRDLNNRVTKRYCNLRKCKSSECKMAGTGNDYIGKVSVTRSNRTCRQWYTNNTNTSTPFSINPVYLNNTLYSDMSVQKAENFCRNPSRNIAGSWCYTTDPLMPEDICNVRDCDKPEECIIVIQSKGKGRQVYIQPHWKESGIHGGLYFSVKNWNPDLADGLIFEIHPKAPATSMITLIIGADKSERVKLYYDTKLIKQKTLPHLIPSGKWATFWLQLRRGVVMLGYEGVPTALFEWTHQEPAKAFDPMFLTYMTILGNPIGMSFKCDECQTENTTTGYLSKFMPVGLWSQTEQQYYKNFTMRLRGTGNLYVPLIIIPGFGDYYVVTFTNNGHDLTLVLNSNVQSKTVFYNHMDEPAYTINKWTILKFSFTEYDVNVTKNNKLILRHTNPVFPMIIYWFTVGVSEGWITWSANCEPVDIDGPPRDGGWSKWSPWQCTVSCGGGEGYRTRTCSNPRPNIFGKMCEGPTMSSGRCNEFECGDIGTETLEKIREHLRTDHYSYVIKESGTIMLQNAIMLLSRVTSESPDAYYEWTLNGLIVKAESNHIVFQGDDITIRNAEPSDSGVYVVVVYRINGQRLVLHVISLAVIANNYQISTRATLPLTINSKAVVLGYIYSDLSQKWLLNNKTFLDHGITTLAAVSSEHFDSLNMSQTGDWTCVIEQKDLGLSWITNYIRIEVKKEPNLYTHLMEDQLTAPLFSWLKEEVYVFFMIIFIVVFTVLMVTICLILYLKFGRLPKRKYKKNRRK